MEGAGWVLVGVVVLALIYVVIPRAFFLRVLEHRAESAEDRCDEE